MPIVLAMAVAAKVVAKVETNLPASPSSRNSRGNAAAVCDGGGNRKGEIHPKVTTVCQAAINSSNTEKPAARPVQVVPKLAP